LGGDFRNFSKLLFPKQKWMFFFILVDSTKIGEAFAHSQNAGKPTIFFKIVKKHFSKMIVRESLYTFQQNLSVCVINDCVRASFIGFSGVEIKVFFRAYSVCAKATFARSYYAQKLLLRILSMRKSCFCLVFVCAKVFGKNVRVAALYSECAHQRLLRRLSMRKSYCCALSVCTQDAAAHTKYLPKLLPRIPSMRKSCCCVSYGENTLLQ